MGEAAAKEPTMEDILSSIRRIIAEEGEQPAETVPGAESSLDSPVEVSSEEKPASLQQLAESLSSLNETPATASATPEPAPELKTSPEPVASRPESAPASAVSGSASSLADIAAGLKAQDTNSAPELRAPEIKEAEPVAKDEPVARSRPAAKPEPEPSKPEPVARFVSEAANPEPKIEMAKATPAPKPSVEPATPPVLEPKPQSIVAPSAEETEFKGALMSPSSNTSVSDSFDRLKRSVMDDLEAKTEAVLRPMLREWLDENLPNMVERMVREEIERVARGI